MRYDVKTTTHMIDGTQVGAWDGEPVFTTSPKMAINMVIKTEKDILLLEGATEVEKTGERLYYKRDGIQYYKQFRVNQEEF